MACQEVEAKHVLGIQPWAEINGEVTTNLDKNANGTNKYCPHGPTCVYNGKEMPCYPTSSENGSITSDILAQIMQYLYHHVRFNQTEATSFLLLDGHGSRSGLSFDNKPSIIMILRKVKRQWLMMMRNKMVEEKKNGKGGENNGSATGK